MKEETNRLLKAIEESNKKMQITETSIQEKDQRIGELDRLIERMEEVWELVACHVQRQGRSTWRECYLFFSCLLLSTILSDLPLLLLHPYK